MATSELFHPMLCVRAWASQWHQSANEGRNRVMLRTHVIVPHEHCTSSSVYHCQGNILIWRQPVGCRGVDLAVSFDEQKGCNFLFGQITNIQARILSHSRAMLFLSTSLIAKSNHIINQQLNAVHTEPRILGTSRFIARESQDNCDSSVAESNLIGTEFNGIQLSRTAYANYALTIQSFCLMLLHKRRYRKFKASSVVLQCWWRRRKATKADASEDEQVIECDTQVIDPEEHDITGVDCIDGVGDSNSTSSLSLRDDISNLLSASEKATESTVHDATIPQSKTIPFETTNLRVVDKSQFFPGAFGTPLLVKENSEDNMTSHFCDTTSFDEELSVHEHKSRVGNIDPSCGKDEIHSKASPSKDSLNPNFCSSAKRCISLATGINNDADTSTQLLMSTAARHISEQLITIHTRVSTSPTYAPALLESDFGSKENPSSPNYIHSSEELFGSDDTNPSAGCDTSSHMFEPLTKVSSTDNTSDGFPSPLSTLAVHEFAHRARNNRTDKKARKIESKLLAAMKRPIKDKKPPSTLPDLSASMEEPVWQFSSNEIQINQRRKTEKLIDNIVMEEPFSDVQTELSDCNSVTRTSDKRQRRQPTAISTSPTFVPKENHASPNYILDSNEILIGSNDDVSSAGYDSPSLMLEPLTMELSVDDSADRFPSPSSKVATLVQKFAEPRGYKATYDHPIPIPSGGAGQSKRPDQCFEQEPSDSLESYQVDDHARRTRTKQTTRKIKSKLRAAMKRPIKDKKPLSTLTDLSASMEKPVWQFSSDEIQTKKMKTEKLIDNIVMEEPFSDVQTELSDSETLLSTEGKSNLTQCDAGHDDNLRNMIPENIINDGIINEGDVIGRRNSISSALAASPNPSVASFGLYYHESTDSGE
jgi:hypothetical protein